MATLNSANMSSAGQRYAPADRESFLDAQQRNRHATWRLSVVCLIAILVMGIPLTLIVTPLLYAVALLAADLINYFWRLPSVFWQFANEIARFGFTALYWLLPPHKHADPQALVLGAIVLILPGILLSLVLWLAIVALFRRGGVGGALLALKAREPDRGELKELQLADVVEEMAIAAGLPPPRVMLVDAPGANAAAIGTSPADARIVVSRRLLDDLNRDELEGVLGHLVASIGNGDLHIAFRVTSVFETCGLLVAIINSPFGSQSRRVLWRILRYSFSGSSGDGGAQEAAAVADILSRNVASDEDDIDRLFNPVKKSRLRSILSFLLFPIFFTNFAIKLSLWFFSGIVFGPAVALLWHTRQYLADASAVQLTRNPDGLASALQKLGEESAEIPGADWASHLFILDPKASGRAPAPDLRQKQMLAQAWAASEPPAGAKSMPPVPLQFGAMQNQFAATMRAALAGDAQAIQRMRTLYQNVSTTDPAFAAQFPNPDDLIAGRRGDVEAMARLRALRNRPAADAQGQPETRSHGGNDPSGVSLLSMVGFHSSLKRRLKRLARMGAHPNFEAEKSKAWVVAFVIYAMFAPFGLLIAALFLFLIAVLTLTSLTFLVVWLAFIHKAFALLGHA